MKTQNIGFSLIELMIVVGIIGILATVAVPKFKNFQVKAKISEAKVLLNHIATLQEAFSLENSTYKAVGAATSWTGFKPAAAWAVADCSSPDSLALGFEILPCDATSPRFTYNIQGNTTDWRATAYSGSAAFNRVLPGAAIGEKMDMEETKVITPRCDTLSQTGSACNANAVAL